MKKCLVMIFLLTACSSPRERCIAEVEKSFGPEYAKQPEDQKIQVEGLVYELCAQYKNNPKSVEAVLDNIRHSH